VAGRLIYSVATSIDGFIASPDGSFDWLLPYPPDSDFAESFLPRIGGLLMGRACLDVELDMQGEVYPGRKVAVMTHRPVENAPHNVTCFEGELEAALAWLQEGVGDIWLYGGGNVAAQALAIDAIDELHVAVVPVTLGEGRRLFERTTFAERTWDLAESRPSPAGYVMLSYQRRRE
jgi:dihydrofolate reductase